jgi:septal ring factor EnvC (AmiA/AmiB activator)
MLQEALQSAIKEAKVKELRQEIESIGIILQQRNQELLSAQRALDGKEREQAAMVQERSELEKEKSGLEATVKKVEDELACMQRHAMQKDQDLADAQAAIESLENDIAASREHGRVLTGQLDKIGAEYKQSQVCLIMNFAGKTFELCWKHCLTLSQRPQTMRPTHRAQHPNFHAAEIGTTAAWTCLDNALTMYLI